MAGVPRIFTSGPFDSNVRVSGFWPLRLLVMLLLLPLLLLLPHCCGRGPCDSDVPASWASVLDARVDPRCLRPSIGIADCVADRQSRTVHACAPKVRASSRSMRRGSPTVDGSTCRISGSAPAQCPRLASVNRIVAALNDRAPVPLSATDAPAFQRNRSDLTQRPAIGRASCCLESRIRYLAVASSCAARAAASERFRFNRHGLDHIPCRALIPIAFLMSVSVVLFAPHIGRARRDPRSLRRGPSEPPHPASEQACNLGGLARADLEDTPTIRHDVDKRAAIRR